MADSRDEYLQKQPGLAGEQARAAARSQPDQEAFAEDVRLHELAVQQTRERRMGPGETPKRAEDTVHPDGRRQPGELIGSPSLEEAEAHGNPILPVDGTGHKVHPSDAFSQAVLADIGQSQGFGGSGRGVPADVRSTAGAAGTVSRNEAENYSVRERIDPKTGELVRTKIGARGEVLDEQREPAPRQQSASRPAMSGEDIIQRDQRQQYRRDDSNGPVL